MLKVVVFDSGYGGEFFADALAEALPVIEIIRVIDWRNAEPFLKSPRRARKLAEAALRPYLGEVDLIIFANHLLSLTSLKYFKRKYKNQKFLGFNLTGPDTFVDRGILILSTKAVTRTISFRNFTFRLKRTLKVLNVDSWPEKIDDGELKLEEIETTIKNFLTTQNFHPEEVILVSSQFNDIKTELREVLGANLKIYDSYPETIRKACKILSIRGGNGKKTR